MIEDEMKNSVNEGASTPNPKRTSQTSRSLPTSKSSCVTITVVPKADHSRNSSSFSDSKHFFCSTCHKCVFNANHDACITKLLNEVNSHKVKPHKTKNSNNLVEQKSHTQKPGRQIFSGHRFSPKKTSAVYEKTSLRSCLRWKPTGKIFTTVGLKVEFLQKVIDSCYEHKVTVSLPIGSMMISTKPYDAIKPLMSVRQVALVYIIPSLTPAVPQQRLTGIFIVSNLVDNYFKPPSNVDHLVLEVPTPVPAASTSSPSLTTVDQDAPSTSTSQTTSKQQSSVIPQGVEDDFYNIEVAHMDNDPYFGIPIPESSSEEKTLQGVIPSNLHHLN
ncbi:hypothetical protein Tco_1538758 [Tanacetum coccineum]